MIQNNDSPFSLPIAVMFFGVSGSGKGTQAELLETALKKADPTRGVVRVEMGALLRALVKTDNTLASRIEGILSAGGLVPSFIPAYLLTDFLSRNFSGTEHLLLDGVARRPIQSKLINQMVAFYGKRPCHSIVLELNRETARARLIARGRHDDSEAGQAIARRFAWYEEQVVPSIATLERLSWQTHHIDGERDVETIHKDILHCLNISG